MPMPPAEKTAPKQQIGVPFKPGQSGNPLGRPKGSRNKLGEDFIAAIHDDFQANGAATIEQVRIDKPHEYLKVIASILPKELHVKDASLGDLSDADLIDLLAAVRSLAVDAGQKPSRKRGGTPPTEDDTGPAGRPH